MIHFGRDVCSNLALATQREWLETNGLGGYASSTLIGLNTRRYHGLLVAALEPPVRRFLLLSKLEETLVIDGTRIDLSSNQYPGTIYPQGHQFLVEFEKQFFPAATFQSREWNIRKTVFMPYLKNSVGVEYSFHGPSNTLGGFEIRPLIAFRDHHALTFENDVLHRDVEVMPQFLQLSPYSGLPALAIHHNSETFVRDGYWYKSFEYLREKERGQDFREDLFSPGYFQAPIRNGTCLWFLAEVDGAASHRSPLNPEAFETLKQTELRRRRALVQGISRQDTARFYMRLAADQFLVRRAEDRRSILAGYPWFTDWGRDTMISIPGLLLVTNHYAAAREVVLTFVKSMQKGLVPNRFIDRPESDHVADYNTVDATLWLFQLVYSLAQRSGDLNFVKQNLYEPLLESFEWHRKGTLFDIHMDDDALITAGNSNLQLTWMDAKAGDRVITPRHGKAVEICALWYNAIQVLGFLARKFRDKVRQEELAALESRAKESFRRVFWNPANQHLNDVVNSEGIDASLRPNQLLAVSLAFSPLSKDQKKAVVNAVTKALVTPYGLRTLAPDDPHYCGTYQGNSAERAAAYHQGTVWPWLLGPYATAYLNAHTRTAKNKRYVRGLLQPLLNYLLNEGVGQIPEVFDGDAAKTSSKDAAPPGKGCIAQAWSVAEIHRVLVGEM
ncbi:MAG: amylo-alpha-1,6-glucosidase [Acidobacteriia bacterium]|nr:amylo-alpha-1,6-glucosidase [Terriglobia bacterium]